MLADAVAWLFRYNVLAPLADFNCTELTNFASAKQMYSLQILQHVAACL